MQKFPIPTGYLFTDTYERGLLETLSIGDYGKHHNVKADFLGYTRPLNGVENVPCMPLSEKWVVTLSTQYGCLMNCTFCFTPDTNIRMTDGSEKKIIDITPGDIVVSYSEGKLIDNAVVNIQSRDYTDKIYVIQLEDHTVLKVTGNHPILVKDGTDTVWIAAEKLTTDMDVIQVK